METCYSDVVRRWVLTLLDFCFMENGQFYNYPTILFYQMGWNLFTVWQASRRHYRLNQTKECRTYYMAYKDTIQEQVLGLIAEKQSATSAIQGKFSTEGLSAMANGTDVRMKLAQSLSKKDNNSGINLQGMFDVLSQETDSSFDHYKQMMLFKEVIGGMEAKEETFDASKMHEIAAMSMLDLFDFNAVMSAQQELATEQDDIVGEYIVDSFDNMPQKKRVRTRKKTMAGQLSLF